MATKYHTKQLSVGSAKPRFASLPLVIPNDTEYNADTNELKLIKGATRDKLIVVDEAIQLLKSIKKPIGVLSIAGPYRSGKSYILSRLLGKSDAFDLGHTMNAKTFGIWMGTSVLACEDHVIILLDTEGIDACTASGTEDTRIFVLTLLLSSFFIYNSKGVVNKSDLDKMSFFVKLASSVAVSKGSKTNPNELRKHFPDFMWLLRDVTLLPADESGKEISPTDYLKKRVLVEGDGFDESASDKVGRAIITFFPEISCVTLPSPSADVSIMRDIEKNKAKLNPDFNKQVDELIQFLKKKVSVKKAFETGQPIRGDIFAHLTQQFVAAVNDPNNTPTLSSTWDSTIKLLIAEVQDRLVDEYTSEFTKIYEEDMKGGPLEEGDSSGEGQSTPTTMLGIHHALIVDKNKKLVEEVGRFCTSSDGNSKGSSFTQEGLLVEFKKKIIEARKEKIKNQEGKVFERDVVTGGVLFTFTQRNRERSQKFCQKVFEELYKPIKDKVDSPGDKYTFEDLRKDLQNINEKYKLQARGPAKWEVYDRAQETIKMDETTFKRLAGYQQKLMKADAQIAEGIRKNEQMSEDINQLRQQLADEAAENQANIKTIQEQHKESMERMEAEMKEREKMEQRKYQEFIDTERERYAEKIQENAQQQAQMHKEMMLMMTEQNKKQIETMALIAQKLTPPPPPKSSGLCVIS